MKPQKCETVLCDVFPHRFRPSVFVLLHCVCATKCNGQPCGTITTKCWAFSLFKAKLPCSHVSR